MSTWMAEDDDAVAGIMADFEEGASGCAVHYPGSHWAPPDALPETHADYPACYVEYQVDDDDVIDDGYGDSEPTRRSRVAVYIYTQRGAGVARMREIRAAIAAQFKAGETAGVVYSPPRRFGIDPSGDFDGAGISLVAQSDGE